MGRHLLIDVVPLDTPTLNTYKVILLGYRHGGAPKIEGITIEGLIAKLRSVLHWPEETTDRIRRMLLSEGRLANESLESPTEQQLRELGFVGL